MNTLQRSGILVAISLVSALVGCDSLDLPYTDSMSAPPTTMQPVVAPAPREHRLELHLKPGDRFPLIKTVTQKLILKDQPGKLAARSVLELVMILQAEAVEENGRKLLSVKYERVKYQQSVGEHTFDFDSNKPQQGLPPEAAVYASMVGNGFQFWIGPDNRIEETVGFEQFAEKCLSAIPEEHRSAVLTRLAASSGDEFVANFIDDSIGLLPYHVNRAGKVVVGDSWTRERRLVNPIRVFMKEKFTLESVKGPVAEISVAGDISRSRVFGEAEQLVANANVEIQGGRSLGLCSIDTTTGLPIEAEIHRNMELRVTTPDGKSYDQLKEITTSIRSFPTQSAAIRTEESL
ncbi:DUF6263 family protein [Calycomorphotria hydatis]|uniref:Lipoprotein n=1 Tax=Calycomorphotria hydatis TaxID=2528027 RepID=A0A517T8E7_9PLAN|nr:DUF6263 family protein [Calycomorphotria hydatis]QDT64651.1 hypothetical protein V22_18910 [Calycomorphotria hydatis]